MTGWISALILSTIARVIRPIRLALRRINRAINTVWSWINRALSNARLALSRVATAAAQLWRGIARLGQQVWSRFTWLIWTYIPRRLSNLAGNLRRWALDRVRDARNLARGLVDALRRWAEAAINGARWLLTQLTNWARLAVNQLRARLGGLLRALGHVLGGPARLANWLIGAMVSALWRYVLRNDVRIFRWVRDRSLGFTLWAAGRIESLIARLL